MSQRENGIKKVLRRPICTTFVIRLLENHEKKVDNEKREYP